MMEIEVVLEIAAHTPQAVGRAVVEVALRGLQFSVGGAAHQVGKIDLRRVGRARARKARETEPEIEVAGEPGLRDVQPRNLVEIDAGVDDPLTAREVT
jgi:hypothetical protein